MKALLRKFLSEGDNLMYPETVELLSFLLARFIPALGRCGSDTTGP